MPTLINGTTGVSLIQDGTVTTTKIVDGSVTPADTQVGALPSMVRLNTAAGWGSTNTTIRRFTNVVTNQGTDITYADSATLGASFTINTNGVYAISYGDTFSTGGSNGVSLNSAQLTTGIQAITAADRLTASTTAGADQISLASTALYLPSGSVIRPHTQAGLANGATLANSQFTITRVA